jgi:hypothetical protein
MVDLTVTAPEVFNAYAPPAFTLLHPLHPQIPTA